MNRIVLLIVALMPSLASAGYPHGYKLTHNSSGIPYKGGYYRYNAYSYKFDWYPSPVNTTNSVSYSYTYNYNNASANAGLTQGGLQDGVFRYDELNVGGLQYDSSKYVSAARSIDERSIESDQRRQIQAAYTRDKVHSILATGQANSQVLKAAESAAVAQLRQEFSAYAGGQPSNGGQYATGNQYATQQQGSQYPMLTQFCARCHSPDLQKASGNFYIGAHETAAAAMEAKFYTLVDRVTGAGVTGDPMPPPGHPQPTDEQKKVLLNEAQAIVKLYRNSGQQPRYTPQVERAPSNEPPPAPLPPQPQQPQPLPQPQGT